MAIIINEIPLLIAEEKLSIKEAVDNLAVFLLKNGPIFGLNKFDEDFRNDIIVNFLEKGTSLFSSFKIDSGNFFNYLYSFVVTLICARRRREARQKIGETIALSESISSYEEKMEAYSRITSRDLTVKSVPFAVKQVKPEDLRSGVSGNKKIMLFMAGNRNEDSELIRNLKKMKVKSIVKTLEILALRSSSSIADEFVEHICEICGLDVQIFRSRLLYCREQIAGRKMRKNQIIERRNRAYYLKNKCEMRISFTEKNAANRMLIENLDKKRDFHEKRWKSLNDKLENGYLSITPTIKDIATALQLSERQVFYYLKNAKNIFMDLTV